MLQWLALENYFLQNLLIVDIGTCITMDVLTNDGIFLGGRISPGIHLRYKSLSFTQQLPLLNFVHNKDIYGNDTESSNTYWNSKINYF